MAKLEAKRENIHMVIVEPCDEEDQSANVRVITRGRVHTGDDVTQGPMSARGPQQGPYVEELIRKAAPHPKFDAWKQKEVMFEARREGDRGQRLHTLGRHQDHQEMRREEITKSRNSSCVI